MCGLYDLETGATRKFPSIKSDIEMLVGTGEMSKYSVIQNLSREFPPTFVSGGEVDWLYPETVELVQALEREEVEYQALLYDGSERQGYHDYHLELPYYHCMGCQDMEHMDILYDICPGLIVIGE